MRNSNPLRVTARQRMVAWSAVWLALLLGAMPLASQGGHPRVSSPAAADASVQHPALRMGTLPNGLRYYVHRHPVPKHRAHLWLAVNVGSVEEDDDQQGFAHFLEHMAFNGTRHFPRQQIQEVIEWAGMTFGSDLNASTNFTETVYQLSVPSNNPNAFANGMQILEDWASGGIRIDSTEVIAERGVVLGEWRMRVREDTLQRRLLSSEFDRLLGAGNRFAHHLPIGLPSLLQTAQAAPIRRFYKDWYRPDLMAVIIVGDIDPVNVEREIQRRFGKIPVVATPRPQTRPRIQTADTTLITVVRDFVSPGMMIAWPVAADLPSTDAQMRRDFVDQLLAVIASGPLYHQLGSKPRTIGTLQFRRGLYPTQATFPGQWRVLTVSDGQGVEALAAALTMFERIAQHGVADSILTKQKAELLRQLERSAELASVQPSARFVQGYTQHYLLGVGNLLSAEQELAFARRLLPSITAADLSAVAAEWRTKQGRRVEYRSHKYIPEVPPTAAEIRALLDSLASTAVSATPPKPPTDSAAEAANAAAATPLVTIPPVAGRIIRETVDPVTGAIRWELSNGARVFVKTTANRVNRLILRASSLGGTSRLPDELYLSDGRYAALAITAANAAMTQLNKQAKAQDSASGVHDFEVRIDAFEEAINLAGRADKATVMFQLLYRQFTDPTFDTLALKRVKGGIDEQTLGNQISSNDRVVGDLAGQNPRFARPSPVSVASFDPSKGVAVLKNRFADAGDFTFVIVGSATATDLRPLVEQYLASLPGRPRTEREQPAEVGVKPARGVNEQQHRSPRMHAVQTQTMLVFDRGFTGSPPEIQREIRRLQALSLILNRRLMSRLREDMAVVYSANAPLQFYIAPQLRARTTIGLVTSPEEADTALKALWQELEQVSERGVTKEELQKAVLVFERNAEVQQQSNEWWANELKWFDQNGFVRGLTLDLERSPITVADLQATARRFFAKDTYVLQVVKPTQATLEKAARERKPCGNAVP